METDRDKGEIVWFESKLSESQLSTTDSRNNRIKQKPPKPIRGTDSLILNS